jgi:DNA helicase-2/ATP-dependent DNA helicase PcrA
VANRLLAGEGRAKRLVATRPDGPEPAFARHASAADELAALVAWIGVRTRAGTAPSEIAVLVRMNAQLEPIEAALTRAGIGYQVRGVPFYERSEVKAAVASLRRMDGKSASLRGAPFEAALRTRWHEALGLVEDEAAIDRERGGEARERQASLDTLLAIVGEAVGGDPAADATTVLDELERRAKAERHGSAEGVNLLTYHRAKGLEWDAVVLPSLEEGLLPIRQAGEDAGAIAEERRLLYVGITRARAHLLLSWAELREGRGGSETRRRPSRFLADLRPPVVRQPRTSPPRGSPSSGSSSSGARPSSRPPNPTGDPVFDALRAWRTEQARETAMPPYIIASDATLLAISQARPRSLEALLRVKGMGDSKVGKYGADILEMVEQAGSLD